MADDPKNPYEAVLADLERERDQINGMIAMIKRRMGLSPDDGPMVATLSSSQQETTELRSDTFFGMTISDAIKKYLSMVKRPKRIVEIARALEEGGLTHTSKNWDGTVQTTLSRMRPVVVKVPNGWGLAEWYPGRKNLDKAPDKAAEKAATGKPNARGGRTGAKRKYRIKAKPNAEQDDKTKGSAEG